jgi:transcriptional regulator with XRE-family HTH domain
LPGTAPDPEPLAERLLRLRGKTSRSVLSRRTVAYDGRGISEETIKAIENGTSAQPTIATIEAIAHALDVPPEEFPEYKLAVIRRQLDEREPPHGVGLEQALSMLAEIEEALGYGEH